ncbi:MAG: hypothetical protein QXU11_11850 [Thermoproteota archaeon]
MIKASEQKVMGFPIQIYFSKLIGTKDPVPISPELIQLLQPIHRFTLRDNLLVEFVEKWRKNPEESYSVLTRGLCQLDELKNRGDMIIEQLKRFLPKILYNASDFQSVKSILSKMLVQREILELEIFRITVDAGLPSIPKIEICRPTRNQERGITGFERIGECDVFIQLEENRFIGFAFLYKPLITGCILAKGRLVKKELCMLLILML